jgi:hypothetical protein
MIILSQKRKTPEHPYEASYSIADPGSAAGLVERVTFHNEENGFCVLRTPHPMPPKFTDTRRNWPRWRPT